MRMVVVAAARRLDSEAGLPAHPAYPHSHCVTGDKPLVSLGNEATALCPHGIAEFSKVKLR